MSKRTLKRQLNLFQTILLGTAGTLGSGIFILTGLAAEVAGPATFLAILVGGFLYPGIGVMLGPLSEQTLAGMHADWTVMGIGGISPKGLTNTHLLIVESEKRMIEAGSRLMVVADHSKFGKNALTYLCGIEEVDMIVTDSDLASEHRQWLEQQELECAEA